MKKLPTTRWLVLMALLATLAVNVMANSLPINGVTQSEISDQFDVYFVPAGYAFAIWGVIYLGLIAYVTYQILPASAASEKLDAIAWPFIGSSIANIAWLFLWHYAQFVLSFFAMVAILLFLILVYERLWRSRQHASRVEFWAVHITFSIYLGWITVATIANATTVLDFLGWGGWGIAASTWAVVMLVIATLVGGLVILRRKDPVYGLVLVWAFVGIARKHAGVSPVDLTAWATAAVVLLLALAQFARSLRSSMS